jgi:hypothetical protein
MVDDALKMHAAVVVAVVVEVVTMKSSCSTSKRVNVMEAILTVLCADLLNPLHPFFNTCKSFDQAVFLTMMSLEKGKHKGNIPLRSNFE